MSTVSFTAAMERALQSLFTEVGVDMLNRVSEHLKLDKEDVIRASGINDMVVTKKAPAHKKEHAEKPVKAKKAPKASVPLPFVGEVNDATCYGIRFNHQLHTQCVNARMGESNYCKTCNTQAEKNATHKPNFGDIRDRLACGLLEFSDPKGKQTLPYINVITKMGLDMPTAISEAEKFGVVIPEEHLVMREITRGRKRNDSSSDASSTSSEEKKAPGRPRKNKPVETEAHDDLLAALKNAEGNATDASDASSVTSSSSKVSSNSKMTQEEKVAKAAAKAEKEAEKEAKAAAKAVAKAEKEAKAAAKAVAKAEKEAEKEAKAAAKAEKEAEKEAKAAAKAAKEAEKEAKAVAKAAKEAEKEAKAVAKAEKEAADNVIKPVKKTVVRAKTPAKGRAAPTVSFEKLTAPRSDLAGCASGVEAVLKQEKKDAEKKKSVVVTIDDEPESEPESDAELELELEEESDDDNADETPVTEQRVALNITIKGSKYVIDENDNLYDAKTHKPIGVFNRETKEIEELDEASDDECDE